PRRPPPPRSSGGGRPPARGPAPPPVAARSPRDRSPRPLAAGSAVAGDTTRDADPSSARRHYPKSPLASKSATPPRATRDDASLDPLLAAIQEVVRARALPAPRGLPYLGLEHPSG